ncbi:MAG: 3-dehydroquinate synthase [Lewinella sp.]|nr:3-dehydroquinate synthase [Lewinella sp.]
MDAGNYSITIGAIERTHFSWLHQRNYAGWLVLVDELTRVHCLPNLLPHLTHQPTVIVEIPSGEQYKTLDTCRFIWEECLRNGLGRRWCMLNLGGGVLGDMGGFAAATYKRGIDFIQVPTTLLSQVDASVGGKLGIDFYGLKNSIGLFAEPQAVWIDPAFLSTLSARELRSGYAEVLKHSLIADADQWKTLRLYSPTDLLGLNWRGIVEHSIALKRDIVAKDPQEKGLRKVLNFGHTIGHALESYWLTTSQPLLHGEAIAAGMVAEAWLSHTYCSLTSEELADITTAFLSIYGHRPAPEAAFPTLLTTMYQDKKNEAESINCTLLTAIGEAKINQIVSADDVVEALRYYNQLGE